VFGVSEFALRASNIPFAILLVSALAWSSLNLFGVRFAWIVFALSPFLAVYMNEARPYIPLMASVTLSLVALLAYFDNPDRNGKTAAWLCVFSLWFAWGLHLLAAYAAPALVTVAVLEARDKGADVKRFFRDWKWPVLAHLVPFGILAAYFAVTMSRAGHAVMMGSPRLHNLAFVFYEFLGFSGLGPPRNALRSSPQLKTIIPYAGWISLGVLACLGLIVIICWATAFRSKPVKMDLFIAFFVGTAFGVAASFIAGHSFWGRHLAALFPFLALAIIQAMASAYDKPTRMVLGLALGLVAVTWGISDIRLRLLPEYGKDDYRHAAEIALSEARTSNGTLVWAADASTGRYYGVLPTNISLYNDAALAVPWPVRGIGTVATDWNQAQVLEFLQNHHSKVVLASSRLDLYDAEGAWEAVANTSSVRSMQPVTAFRIYVF
jgi:hypothetical protein